MKVITLMIFSLLLVNLTFAQSKKDIEQNLLQHEEKIKNIESEITNIKINLTNTTTTLGLVSKSNLDLEKLVKDQSILIEKLIKQNDSLLIVFKVKKDADFVSTPKNEEDSIIFLIQSYYGCKKWEDRLVYVLNSETVKSSLKGYYTDKYKSSTIKKDEISIQGSDYKINESFKVVISGSTIIYCKRTSEGFKIDWEATVGYNQKSFPEFLSEKSNTPTTLRLSLKISPYYSDDYKITTTDYYSFNCYAKEGGNDFLYMKKTSTGANDLKKLVADGKTHDVIIEIGFKTIQHKDYYDLPEDYIFITKFIKEGWSKE